MVLNHQVSSSLPEFKAQSAPLQDEAARESEHVVPGSIETDVDRREAERWVQDVVGCDLLASVHREKRALSRGPKKSP